MTSHFHHEQILTIIAGGAAGDHTVAGVRVGDVLKSVLHVDFTDASETGADITAEFSITADDTINNAGGTNTTGGFLIVFVDQQSATGGRIDQGA